MINTVDWLYTYMTQMFSWLYYLTQMTGKMLKNFKICKWWSDTVTLSLLGLFSKFYQRLEITNNMISLCVR